MKTIVKTVTFALGILAMFLSGVTFLNVVYKESCQLLVYDLRNGFADNRVYMAAFVLFILLFLWAGWGYWQCIFGRMRFCCTIQLKNRLFLAVLDEQDGKDIKADKKITFRMLLNILWIAAIVLCVCVNGYMYDKALSAGTWEKTKTIGHSFGMVDGDAYTGSLEAFEYNYALGRRTMEVDLILTTDNRLVLKHDWDEPEQEGISENAPPSEETFLDAKIMGKYTPLSFAQLCEIMRDHPDLWIVTDTKSIETEEVREQFEVMVDTAGQTGCKEILDRIIVQVYNEEMYRTVNSIYHFNNYIFTMYWRFDDNDWLRIARDVCRFCVNNGIETMTIRTNRISPAMQAIADHYERNVYVHTVNDMEAAAGYFDMGVTGIYTDTLNDKDL